MGMFDFTAVIPTPGSQPDACSFVELPTQNFFFSGIFSRNSDGTAFFTLNDTDRPATFDGQIDTSSETAARIFEACNCPTGTNVMETLTVSLLSRSQVDALPDPTTCPSNALSGGTPSGPGITGPGSTSAGFDAVLACGQLFDAVQLVETDCSCSACGITYAVQGVRK
jgi:hypothetical protein